MLTPEEKEKVIKKYKFWRLKNNFINLRLLAEGDTSQPSPLRNLSFLFKTFKARREIAAACVLNLFYLLS